MKKLLLAIGLIALFGALCIAPSFGDGPDPFPQCPTGQNCDPQIPN